jgi:hypothetical protein
VGAGASVAAGAWVGSSAAGCGVSVAASPPPHAVKTIPATNTKSASQLIVRLVVTFPPPNEWK